MADNCVVFLLADSYHLADAFKVFEKWGLDYGGSIACLTGEEQITYCIIGYKGTVIYKTNMCPQLLTVANWTYSHLLPDYFFDLIEQMFPENKKRITYYVLNERDGWSQADVSRLVPVSVDLIMQDISE